VKRVFENAVIKDDAHGFDPRDVSLKAIIFGTVLILLVVLSVVLFFHPFFSYVVSDHSLSQSTLKKIPPDFDVNSKFPSPRLQSSPEEDLKSLRSREDVILNSYSLDEAMHRFLSRETGKEER
jgi:hypothetical protein